MGRPNFHRVRTVSRCVFHVAAGLSACVLVACLIAWPLSYRREVAVGSVASSSFSYAVGSLQGRLEIRRSRVEWVRPGFFCFFNPIPRGTSVGWSYADWHHRDSLDPMRGSILRTNDSVLGFAWERTPFFSILAIPFLYLTLLSAILPALWLRGFLRRRRQARLARRGFPVEPGAPAR